MGVKEEWVSIKGFNGYEVSRLGQVRRMRDGRILTKRIERGSYYFVDLNQDGVRRRMFVHYLVAMSFLPNDNNYKYIKHKDGNGFNNCLNNLEFSKYKSHIVKHNEQEQLLLKKYGVKLQKDLPLYKKYKCRYNIMHRFCKNNPDITTVWNTFVKFYSDLYPIYGDKFNDDVNYRMYLPWNKKEYNVDTIAFGNKAEVNRNCISTKRYTINGVSKTLKEWAKDANITEATLRDRLLGYQDSLPFEEIVFGIGKQKRRYDKNLTLSNDATIENKKARRRASRTIAGYKSRDAKKGLQCDLDIEWYIQNISSKPCIYCGDNVNIGCDRIDNSKAHSKDNVVPCCKDCNIARGDNFTHEEFLYIGERIKEVKSKRKLNNYGS